MLRSPSSPSGGSVRAAAALAVLVMLRATLAFSAPRAPSQPEADRKAEASAHLRHGAELIDAEDLEGKRRFLLGSFAGMAIVGAA